ncbi:hypothetical protein Tco_0824444 [Tanacetum coccineum]|uniref:Uncharacterized protein n=1 Tax=Tanacetum coccineum TaxID=301880 RepID=A0ABQ5AKR1_9ASTR
MSNSEDSTITNTAVSSPFGGLSDIRFLGVDGPPMMSKDPYAYVVAALQASLSPDYVLGPEYPPAPDFVPEPVYPEFMPPEDEDPEEDDDEDPEEDHADYPANERDDGDDEDKSSDDDKDDDVNIKGDEEEEEHPAPVDSTAVALPAVDHAPSAKEIEPFETDKSTTTPPPHPAYRVTARISIRDEPPTPFWSDTEVARLLAIPTPPPSLLSSWSSPLPQIPSPPLLVSPPPPVSPTYLLGYRVAMIWLGAEAPSTSYSPHPHIILSHTIVDTPPSGTPPLLPIPLPTSSPSLYEVGESSSTAAARPTGGFRADYGFVATMDREIRRDLERDISYGITDTWDEMLVDMPGAPAIDDTKLGRQMTEFTTRVRQDTDEIYMRLDDEQIEERDARMSREA